MTKAHGIDTLDTIRVFHVNAGTKASWRATIGDKHFIDHDTPEDAFSAAMAWARGEGE